MFFSALRHSWRHEKESAYLYEVLAAQSKISAQQQLFAQLAQAANEQAAIWEQTISQYHYPKLKSFHPSWRIRIIKQLIILFGPETIRPILSAAKVRGMSIYNINAGHVMPEHISQVGKRHQSFGSANTLRAAIFGINDGLLSNTSLIMGMAGASATHNTILLAGIAGALAGAFSMAAGEFISVRSQCEMLEYQIEQERKELELYPLEEAAELSLIYQARGLNKADADKAAQTIIQNPLQALNTLAREELGLDPDNLISPYKASIASFLAFIIGGTIPLIPLTLNLPAHVSIRVMLMTSSMTLLIMGAVISLFTGRSAIKNGLRMLIIGLLAASLTYFIGNGINHIL